MSSEIGPPCIRCGAPLKYSILGYLEDDVCDGCWEVEGRLHHYLQNPKGRAYIIKMLAEVGPEPCGTHTS
jgi:hypothetical protein